MKLIDKFNSFVHFALIHKIPKMLKKKSDEELLELYRTYAPCASSPNVTLYKKIYGLIAVYTITCEFVHRYPNKPVLQNWDYTKELNLHEIIGQPKHHGTV